MKTGRVVVFAVLAIAMAGSITLVLWLKHLQGVAAEKAAQPCVIPSDLSCQSDDDCLLVKCRSGTCDDLSCGVPVSRNAMKAEHHPCLVPTGLAAPKGCPAIPTTCEPVRCAQWPKCVAGVCTMLAPDAGG